MARNRKAARKISWSLDKQTAQGTPFVIASLDKFIDLVDPLTYQDEMDILSDKGMVGKGHEFATTQYVNSRHITGSVAQQPLPADMITNMIGAALGNVSSTGTDPTVHTIKLTPVVTTPVPYTIGFGLDDDGSDIVLNDVVISQFNLAGSGVGRIEFGFDFLASKATALGSATWPAAAALDYVNHFSGTYTVATVDKKTQLRSFNLSVNPGVSLDRAWQKGATEAARPYPSYWAFDEEAREHSLEITFEAEAGDLDTWRGYQYTPTEVEVVVTCLGDAISSGTFVVGFEMHKGIVTGLTHEWSNGILLITATLVGNYEASTTLTPLTFTCHTEDAAILAAP